MSPVERSLGSRQYRRLNRGGDRQANVALHRIVETRRRFDPRTREYYERRIAEGRTRCEIVRSLKCYVAGEVFHLTRPASSQPPLYGAARERVRRRRPAGRLRRGVCVRRATTACRVCESSVVLRLSWS
ncbi:IS110 family transposase [Streptomyces sp. NBC_00576]|nr:transposase [Streptomyces sp. NBC_00576]WUB70034.1 IS110 family transposase [Streptomyces sp. NBC_00576]